MMDTNQPSTQRRKLLLAQQRTEWNHLLGLETAKRLALYARQQQNLQKQVSDPNPSRPLDLSRIHQSERDALRLRDRQHRMDTLKRHAQEAAALTENTL